MLKVDKKDLLFSKMKYYHKLNAKYTVTSLKVLLFLRKGIILIVEFSVTNFRSFKEKQTLSMTAANFPEHLEANTCQSGEENIEERLLRSAAVYGANGAGKTNILRALQTMQMIIVHSANPDFIFPCLPFKFSEASRNSPTEFVATFIQEGMRYQYGFSIKDNRIEKEWLIEFVYARGRMLFERSYDSERKDYTWEFSIHLKGQRTLWSESTRPNALFLSTAVQFNSIQLLPAYLWFQKRLVIIFGQGGLNSILTINLLNQEDGKKQLLSFLTEAGLKEITDIEMRKEQIPHGATLFGNNHIVEQKPNQSPHLLRFLFKHPADVLEHAYLEWADESAGTQTMFRNAGAWINVLKNGEVLLMDEIETNLHPLLIEFLIRKFHSSETNSQNAQILFTTHNTALLDQTIFRRDQFWFAEKNDKGESHIYPLQKYKPRNDAVLETWYKRGRYRAIPKLKAE